MGGSMDQKSYDCANNVDENNSTTPPQSSAVVIQFTFVQIIIGVKVIYSRPVFSWAGNESR